MIKVREKKLDFVHQRNSQFKSVPLGIFSLVSENLALVGV